MLTDVRKLGVHDWQRAARHTGMVQIGGKNEEVQKHVFDVAKGSKGTNPSY